MLTPLALSTGAITIAHANGLDDHDPFDRPASKACTQTASYAPLAKLPPGIVATDVSYGPFLLALTPHSVLAGPYHHLSQGHHGGASEPGLAARSGPRGAGGAKVTYVMICGPRPPDGLAEPERSRSLWGRLRAGAVPDWLEPVEPSTGPGLRRVPDEGIGR